MAGRVEKGGDNDAEVLHRPRRLRGRQPIPPAGSNGAVADAGGYLCGWSDYHFSSLRTIGGAAIGGEKVDELMKISYESGQPTVSARDLYDLLSEDGGTKGTERFSKWFERYRGYGFEQGSDFSTPNKKVRVQTEGTRDVRREVEDYDLSVDMAKQICMLQRTNKGMELRQYLLDLEKAWNTPEQVFARALKMADQTINRLQSDITRMRPKEIFADAVAASQTSILVGDMAKLLKQNGVDMGAQRLFTWLRDNGYLIRRKGADWNMPTQRSMEMGLFEIKESTHLDGNGCNVTTRTPKVTGKGQQYFINKFLGGEQSA